VLKKNISDGVESQNGSISTSLEPPLFWLDNIFKPQHIQVNPEKDKRLTEGNCPKH
jgi:hypothetical protein